MAGLRMAKPSRPAPAGELLARLRAMANPANVAGMARFGINVHNTLGISVADLRAIAKPYRKDHALAAQLWDSGIHEARILATLIDDPAQVDEAQLERWVRDFDSWDVCDQCCSNLFSRTPFAYGKALEWSARGEDGAGEFVRRAGLVLMAALAVHDRRATDEQLAQFLPAIERGSSDERNFVKKAVNWALRQIGKRNRALNRLALRTARAIAARPSKAARWIAADALRELQSDKVQARLKT